MLLLLAPARRVMIRAAWVLLAALLAAVAGATALNNSLGLTPQVRIEQGRTVHTHMLRCCTRLRPRVVAALLLRILHHQRCNASRAASRARRARVGFGQSALCMQEDALLTLTWHVRRWVSIAGTSSGAITTR
jgi:hypothetical protein